MGADHAASVCTLGDVAPGMDWERARKREAGANVEPPPLKRQADKPPSDKQIALLRKLAAERDQPFAMPRTSRQASARITDFLGL